MTTTHRELAAGREESMSAGSPVELIRTPVTPDSTAAEAVVNPVRLLAVARTGLLDTDPEGCFDDLVDLARAFVGGRHAFFTIVDAHRSFWKSAIGLPPGGVREAPVEDSLCGVMIADGAPLVVDDAQGDIRVRDLGAVRTLRMGACLTYPVRDADDQIIGGLSVAAAERRAWTPGQQQALETLARSVSTEIQLRRALAESRTRTDDLQVARDEFAALARSLQQSLLPPSLPVVAGLDTAAAYLPAGHGVEVVGDFYDLFTDADGVWVVIGDVCGHGVEAAKLTALARYTVRSQATEPHATPAKVLNRVNDALRAQNVDRFLTAAIAHLRRDGDGWAGTMCSAGHEPPMIRRADTTVETPFPYGFVLGIHDEIHLTDTAFALRTDDTLVLVTDGVTEARAGRGAELFGDERLAALLTDQCDDLDANGIVERIVHAVDLHAHRHYADDTAAIVLRSTR